MSQNITKEGIEVKAGQVWSDLDRRMNDRKVKVWRVADGYAACFVLVNGQSGKVTTIAIRRMHKSSTGWALVNGNQSGDGALGGKGGA